MKRLILLVAVIAVCAKILPTLSFATAGKAPEVKADNVAKSAKVVRAPRHIDLAICLDTSGSMSGLIESAKQKLWAVVNELATAKPRPVLRVALYHYGNDGLDSKTGWVKQLCPLTDDLDTVYGKLFALKTNGGTEYVARVTRAATNELKWNTDKNTLRIIFVAGNEAATQDNEFKLRDVCSATVSKGIIINTIFCGPVETGRNTGWADAARWADGRYAAIDQNNGTVAITTPYDKKLANLGAELNKTYISYGVHGKAGAANQTTQDANASTVSASAAAQRAVSKSSGLYNNARWDLVDASREKDFDITKVKEEDLPDEMKKMDVKQRKAYIKKQVSLRTEIQEKIQKLNVQRDTHVKKEMTKQGLSDTKSLDTALRAAIREQAEKKDFKFEEKSEKNEESESK